MTPELQNIVYKILEATNGGFDLIQEIYPTASTTKNFRVRSDDKDPSASLKMCGDRYRLTDWSGTLKSEDCFGIWALENNTTYGEAIHEIARKLQAERGIEILPNAVNYYKYEYREYPKEECEVELNDKNFSYITKDFTDAELEIISTSFAEGAFDDEGGRKRAPLLTHEVCKRVNFYSLEKYFQYSEEKKKVMEFRSTEKFPIFALINKDENNKEWMKIYMPKGAKRLQDDGKDRRFKYLGGRPKGFIFGESYLSQAYKDAVNKEIGEAIKHCKTDEEKTEKENEIIKDFKLERIVIATGISDGLNLMALGEVVVWFNSETEKPDRWKMREWFKMAKDIIYVPDLDETGKREGRALALEHYKMKTLWLDNHTMPGQKVKDFKDYVRCNVSRGRKGLIHQTKLMLEGAMPAKFWEERREKSGKIAYDFNHVYAFYFLRLNGFCRIEDNSRKEGWYFAKIDKHIVKELNNTQPVKDFFKDFLLEKQKLLGVREIPHALVNSIIASQKLSDNTLAYLHKREIDFSNNDPLSQYYFFGSTSWKVTKDKVLINPDEKRFVLESKLVENLVYNQTGHRLNLKKIEPLDEAFFNIKEIGDNFYDIKINRTDCDLLNFMIQTSRVFWDKERKNMQSKGIKKADFYEKTKFQLVSEHLEDEENDTQKQHLVNKIFTLGYMLHRYKDDSRPWVPYAVDDSVVEDNVAEGGAGKSLLYKALKFVMNVHEINGKDDIENDKFLYEGVTKHTDFILFDDVKRNFTLEMIYQATTGNVTVNAKNMNKESFSYKDSGKFGVSSNYSIRDRNGSSNRRRLTIGYSDYYHAENESRERREPTDDFGYILFKDWDDKQWNIYINFLVQCLQFYLGCTKKIGAPENNIMFRAYLSEMGEWFHAWANDFFKDYEDGYVMPKKEVEAAMTKYNPKYLTMTPNAFKKKLKAWCKVYAYELEDRIPIALPERDEFGHVKIDRQGNEITKTMEHIKLVKIDTQNPDEDQTEENINIDHLA